MSCSFLTNKETSLSFNVTKRMNEMQIHGYVRNKFDFISNTHKLQTYVIIIPFIIKILYIVFDICLSYMNNIPFYLSLRISLSLPFTFNRSWQNASKPFRIISNVFHFMSIWLTSKHLVLSHLTLLLLQSSTELLLLSLHRFLTFYHVAHDLMSGYEMIILVNDW